MSSTLSVSKSEDLRRVHHLCASLAKLLEKPPPTYADETPVATWVDTVEQTSSELIKALGRSDAISIVLRTFAELNKRSADAVEIVQRYKPGADTSGVNLWHALLDCANSLYGLQKGAERRFALERDGRVRAETVVEQQTEEILRLRAEIEELRRHAPRRFKTVAVAV